MSHHLGLRLTLGGAPNTPHILPGLPGLYWPDQPTPVGGPGEMSEEDAKRVAEDPGCHVELVKIPPNQVEKHRRRVAEATALAQVGIAEARAAGLEGSEPAITADQIEALTPGETDDAKE